MALKISSVWAVSTLLKIMTLMTNVSARKLVVNALVSIVAILAPVELVMIGIRLSSKADKSVSKRIDLLTHLGWLIKI